MFIKVGTELRAVPGKQLHQKYGRDTVLDVVIVGIDRRLSMPFHVKIQPTLSNPSVSIYTSGNDDWLKFITKEPEVSCL